jgi:hypothetical protein
VTPVQQLLWFNGGASPALSQQKRGALPSKSFFQKEEYLVDYSQGS